MTDLVVISLEPWDDVWRRNQHVVDGLLRSDPGLRVLFVEPAPDPLHALRTGHPPRRGAGLRDEGGYGGRLLLLTPTKWLPRAVGSAADRMLQRAVRRAVRRLGWARPVLWVNDPMWASMPRSTGWPTLYDMTDDWVEAARAGRISARLRSDDAELMRTADRVVVCSEGLARSRGGLRDVRLIPNAVDVARYRRPTTRPPDLPAGLVAVYVGTLHEDRLDVDLCVRVARALDDVGARLVLVGPNALSEENARRLVAARGVTLLGRKPFDEVPGYLQHATTLVVPHVVTAFTDSLDPIKLYEYLAVGRPIVSTPVAGFRETSHTQVTIADRQDLPASAVASVRAHEPAQDVPADLPTWDQRVREFREVIAGLAGDQ